MTQAARARRRAALAAGAASCLRPGTALADMPMVFVAASAKLIAWWTLPAAAALEAAVLRRLFGWTWGRALLASLAVNAATLLLGWILYAVLGFLSFRALFALSAGHLAPAANLLLIALGPPVVDALVEMTLLILLFRAAPSPRDWLLFLLANVASSALVLAGLALA